MAEEIELKLTAPAETLAAVRAHPAVAAVARGRMRTSDIVSTYYDTPERDLAAAGVALRLRRTGARWLQTVKGNGDAAAGVHRRAEFEWRLSAPRLDTAKLARTPWRKLFARNNGRYRRVFATTVRRSELPLAFADGTRATLCLDVGEIRAGHRRAALNEIEVELERGDPSRLFELAAALAADLPVRVMHTSKAERGYALASDAAPRPRRARPVELAPDAPALAALAAIVTECIAQVEANAEAMLAHDDPEYLHQLRVGWRRLRSLLKLTARVASPESLAPLEEELRWLGSILGPARDCDVFALETLPKIAAQFRGLREIARLRARVARRRRRLSSAAREAIATPRFQKLLLALGAFFATLSRAPILASVPPLARDWIGFLLQRRHDKLSKRARHIHRIPAAERHRARVAAKKLRYAAEFFASLFSGKRAEAYIAALSKLQSVLGRLNDVETAGKLLDELAPGEDRAPGAAHAAGIVRGWLAASLAPELKRLRDAQRAFGRCAPFWTA
ncbi:MAG TPA: CHAD domain-containing protein [Casimicrobiaceae bacterium]|nr:CHAD domain-containing protein [Casimicrobiaceae bacterium]